MPCAFDKTLLANNAQSRMLAPFSLFFLTSYTRVFQCARSIRHVDLKTGSDSVTLVNSKIC